MNDASFASLSPTLLARKGGAKPAMRPQLAPIPDASGGQIPANLDDLGWNDMGEEGSADVVPLKSAISMKSKQAEEPVTQDNAPEAPKKRRSALKRGKRAAFTLRLDQERHLKLRLAATMNEISAQELVTQALDAMLGEIDDLDSLAARMKKN